MDQQPPNGNDRPLMQSQVDRLHEIARLAGVYYQALLKQGIPDELASQLTRDWHITQHATPGAWHGTTDRIVGDVLQAIQRASGSRHPVKRDH